MLNSSRPTPGHVAPFAVEAALAVTTGAPGRAQERPPASVPSDITVLPVAGQQEKPGAASLFRGAATVRELFALPSQTTLTAGTVNFASGARSDWRTHPAGQLLVITAGRGWVQEWNHPKQPFKAGDVVWIPAGVKHWHGAAVDTAMSHIAIQGKRDGASVRWLEPVTDAQYGAAPPPR